MKSSRIGPPGIKRISLVEPAKSESERAARFQAATTSIVAHVPTGTLASLSLSRFEIGAVTTRAMSRWQR